MPYLEGHDYDPEAPCYEGDDTDEALVPHTFIAIAAVGGNWNRCCTRCGMYAIELPTTTVGDLFRSLGLS